MTETLDTTKEIVCTGSTTNIKLLIDTCNFLHGSWVLLEQNPREVVTETEQKQNLLYFEEFSAPLPSDLLEHTNGRIFNANFELRWEQCDTDIQVIYMGVTQSLPTLVDTSYIIADCQYRIRSYYLFGRRLSDKQIERIGPPAQVGDFAEVRIPRLLRYPAKLSKNFVKLEICEYIHKQTGEVVLFRFTRPLEADA